MRVLAGDIGGTNSRFALVEADEQGVGAIECRRSYDSNDFPGVGAALEQFLEDSGARADRISLALACPVRKGACTLPNLGWSVEEGALRETLGPDAPELDLLNDLEAVGYALSVLPPQDFQELQEGTHDPEGVVALIAAGTGLGEGFLVPHDGGFRACPSEGGHAEFAPRTEIEWQLKKYLEARHGRVSTERVVSGPGLEAIYDFLRELDGPATSEEPSGRGEERAAVIAERGMERSDATCIRALDLFVSAYGARAGDLALTTGATGGVCIAGGIAPKILPRLRKGDFLEALRGKGRLSAYVEAIPVRVVVNPDAGLIGAAVAAARQDRGRGAA